MRVKTNAHINRPISLFSWYNRPTGRTTQSKNSEATRKLGETAWDSETFLQGVRNRRGTPRTTMGVIGEAGLSWVWGQSFQLRGRLRGGGREVTHAVTAALCSCARAETVFLTLPWTRRWDTPKKKVFLSSDDCIFNQPRANSLQSTVFSPGNSWQALTLGSTTAKWRKLRMVPRRPFLSCSLPTTLSEYITLSSKPPSGGIQVET